MNTHILETTFAIFVEENVCMLGNCRIELKQSHRSGLWGIERTNNALGVSNGPFTVSVCSVLHVLLSGGYPLEMNRQCVCADNVCLCHAKKVVVEGKPW